MELQCKEVPVIKYQGKIRIVEGLEHALKILLADTDRTFEIDLKRIEFTYVNHPLMLRY